MRFRDFQVTAIMLAVMVAMLFVGVYAASHEGTDFYNTDRGNYGY